MEQTNQNQSEPKPQSSKPSPVISSDYSKMDDKTIATIKASAIWGAVAAVITSLAAMIASYYFLRNMYGDIYGVYGKYLGNYLGANYAPQVINVGALVSSLIYGAIGGAVAGWVIAKFYPVFVSWQKKYLGGKLDSFFKILFWPSVVGVAISLLTTGALNMLSSAFTVFLITVLADLAAAYIYAKMMDKAVGKYYK